MFDKEKVIAYFDNLAPTWDKETIKDDVVINNIFDNAKIHAGEDILDVACGTGILVPYFINRNIKSYIGIDISSKMIDIAKNKYSSTSYQFVSDDIMTHEFDKKFDRIIVYNAFPHFIDQEILIENLTKLLKENGLLTIAHGMSREAINHYHSTSAKEVSHGLISIDELEDIFKKYLTVSYKVSNDKMYQIIGIN